MRDKEDRVRFSGYDVANFKIFVFCLAVGDGGDRRRHVHAAGRVHVALVRRHRALDRDGDLLRGRRPAFARRRGGRNAVVNCGKTLFSESFPELWLFAMGGLFIAVVLVFPRGLAGLSTDQIMPWLGLSGKTPPGAAAEPRAPAPHQPSREARSMPTSTDFLLALEGRHAFRSTASRRSTISISTSTRTSCASSSAPTAPAKPRYWT